MEEVLPNALMIGVDYELFWELNPKTLAPFIKAFSLKQKYDDTVAWQHGYYVLSAIACSFGKNKKYPDAPVFSKEVINEDSEKRAQILKQRFMKHAQLLNSKFGKDDTNNAI